MSDKPIGEHAHRFIGGQCLICKMRRGEIALGDRLESILERVVDLLTDIRDELREERQRR